MDRNDFEYELGRDAGMEFSARFFRAHALKCLARMETADPLCWRASNLGSPPENANGETAVFIDDEFELGMTFWFLPKAKRPNTT